MAFSNVMLAIPGVTQGMENANALSQEALQNRQTEIANQYAPATNQANINSINAQTSKVPYENQYQQLVNQNYTRSLDADISQKQAMAALYGSEVKKNTFLMNNPQYWSPEGSLYGPPPPDQVNYGRPGQQGSHPVPQPNQQPNMNSVAPQGIPASTSTNPMAIGNGGGTALGNYTINGQLQPPPQTIGDYKRAAMVAASQGSMAEAQTNIKNNNAWQWKNSTDDAKNYQMAQMFGAGIDPDEALNGLSQGNSVDQILQSHGYAPGQRPDPDFLATKGDIADFNKRKTAIAQVNNLNDWVSSSLGPYSQTIRGYSPTQIEQAISGMNKDQQVNFLAARMIQPDIQGFRIQVAGLRAGRGMVQEMLDRSMAESKIFQGLVTPDVFTAAQNLATQKLTESASAANKAITTMPSSKSSSDADSKQKVLTYNPQTGRLE